MKLAQFVYFIKSFKPVDFEKKKKKKKKKSNGMGKVAISG